MTDELNTTTGELAELAALAIEQARETAGHQDCAPGGIVDQELGVVCTCGTILGDLLRGHGDGTVAASAEAAGPVHALTPPSDEIELGRASRVDAADPITASLDVIDPTQLYTPAMVEERMLDVLARLDRGMHFERLCLEELYRLELEYDLAHARALLAAAEQGGASDVRSARAKVAVGDLFGRLQVARLKTKATASAMHNLRSELSGYQSIAKSVAASFGAAGTQPGRAF